MNVSLVETYSLKNLTNWISVLPKKEGSERNQKELT